MCFFSSAEKMGEFLFYYEANAIQHAAKIHACRLFFHDRLVLSILDEIGRRRDGESP
jgi:hypothetical protein